MGKVAEPVPAYVKLFGACHGGPDHKAKHFDVMFIARNTQSCKA